MLSELWLEVIKNLNCQEIINLSLVNKYFNTLIKENDCYLKRKFQGFPRPAPLSSRIYRYDEENDVRVTRLINCFSENSIVRGDLVYFSNIMTVVAIYIFDGHNIIKLDDRTLPRKFKIINNNVPLDYWEHCFIDDMMWFDCSSVRQQCIDNIRIRDNLISTSFQYNKNKYEIEYYLSKLRGVNGTTISKFKDIFVTHDVLKLRLPSHIPLHKIVFEGNVLFLYQNDHL